MRILGIDPGTATLGFGVIDCRAGAMTCVQAGVITTPAGVPLPQRLETIYAELNELLDEHRPDHLAVELLYFAANTTTAFSVGQARGVVLLAGAQHHLPTRELTPLQVKQAVTGYGRASKRQIQEMVKTLLKLSLIPKPDDAADALAIAITAAQMMPEVLHARH
jgi:crossover junction endodeoxyribonuclease RuvC